MSSKQTVLQGSLATLGRVFVSAPHRAFVPTNKSATPILGSAKSKATGVRAIQPALRVNIVRPMVSARSAKGYANRASAPTNVAVPTIFAYLVAPAVPIAATTKTLAHQAQCAGPLTTHHNAFLPWAIAQCPRAAAPTRTALPVIYAPTAPARRVVNAMATARRSGVAWINSAIRPQAATTIRTVRKAPFARRGAASPAAQTTPTARWVKPAKRVDASKAVMPTPTAPWIEPAKRVSALMKSAWAMTAPWHAKSIYFAVQVAIVIGGRDAAEMAYQAAFAWLVIRWSQVNVAMDYALEQRLDVPALATETVLEVASTATVNMAALETVNVLKGRAVLTPTSHRTKPGVVAVAPALISAAPRLAKQALEVAQ